MSEPTEIEKHSLEAHVELCAQRYKFLEDKLSLFEEKMDEVSKAIIGVKNTVEKMAEKRNDQIIGWGIGIIGSLIAVIAYMLVNYVLQ